MILVKFSDGLGNQMFQYAIYKRFQLLGKEVYGDLESYDRYNNHSGFEIEKIFNLEVNKATTEYIKKYSFCKNENINNFMIKKLGKIKNNVLENNHKYIHNLYEKDNKRLIGYWQNIKYINPIKNELLKDFSFNDIEDEENLKILNKINNCNSVSIHIRRGDYIKNKSAKARYYVCDINYYNKAIKKIIEENREKVEFFIFSNDIDWVAKNIKIPKGFNYTYVNHNSGKSSFRDMQLMSNCKHNIIANSTFSWWAAYLNKNKYKKVIAPDKWFANESNDKMNLYEDNWIRI